ncbi:MAG: glycosyltransferase [Eubacteriales bacterium]|nr:glycosyltransferase [Eubacteriales bacterium]
MTGNTKFDGILDKIDMMIEQGNTEESQSLLEQIYRVKPVGVKWFVSNAKLMFKKLDENPDNEEGIRNIIDFLKGKCSLDYMYEGTEEYVSFMLKLYKRNNNLNDYNRLKYEFDRMCGVQEEPEGFESEFEHKECGTRGLESGDFCIDSRDGLKKLCDYLYICHEDFATSLFVELYKRNYNEVLGYEDLKVFNIFPLLLSGGKVILLCDESDNESQLLYRLMEIGLRCLGVLPEFVYLNSSESGERDYSSLKEYVYNEEEYNIVISKGFTIDEICVHQDYKRHCERLTRCEKDYLEDKLHVGRVGGYLKYIDTMYGVNSRKCIEGNSVSANNVKNNNIKYSFVIPARNNNVTLRHTLMTCLKIHRNDYEIVVSDNSDVENDEIKKLCEELTENVQNCREVCNNTSGRIKYIKTTYNFPLARSFEFAILNSTGEFIIPLGADDGVFPWILDVLDNALDKHPEEDLFQWGFAGYQWPGVSQNHELKNIFNVPHIYEGKEVSYTYKDSSEVLRQALESPDKMYDMPTLYMTSGFRRRYLETMYEKTGRLWGGVNQDISTGMLNLCIYDRYVHINETLSIVGQSSSSIGCQNLKVSQKAKKEFHLWDNNMMMGQSCPGYIERMIPDVGGEVIYLYISLLYGISLGVVDEDFIKSVDWSNAFSFIIRQMDISDDEFFRKLNTLRLGAFKLTEGDIEWFDNLCSRYISPGVAEDKADYNGYDNGDSCAGSYDEVMRKDGFTVNAVEHGIRNVEEAVDFCVSYLREAKEYV